MKHWLVIGGVIIGTGVLLLRSRIAENQTTRPIVTTQGVSLPDRYFAPTTASSTRPAGVRIDPNNDPRIASTTRSAS